MMDIPYLTYQHYDDYYDEKPNEVNLPIQLYFVPMQRLASSVDLRMWLTPIKHQADGNTCCANAFATICEYMIRRMTNRPYTMSSTNLSRLFIYYNGQRQFQHGYHMKDIGVDQRSVALGIRKYGICEEEYWPYDLSLLNIKPSSTAYHRAKKHAVTLLCVPITIEAIETCLHHQILVPIDIIMDEETDRIIESNYGYLNMQELSSNKYADKNKLHTMVIVGYDRTYRHFIVQNSYGKHWGYHGYFYLPYDYISSGRRINYNDQIWTVMNMERLHSSKLPPVHQLILPRHGYKEALLWTDYTFDTYTFFQ
ncbi:unnamed protein product [Adineta ricciae]|uniref:Peptidase C1A papain C-terminal domain-containing protein n=1 Tax=Adineta ricciae TaxID=249248 RepID=A0A815R2E0_ADIRI|nr:unnamed protein product [Adineta ricciae]CAF1470596.1 unnamed protein product [Adineta ricciae]